MSSVESQMESGLLVARQVKPPSTFWRRVSLCSFALVAGATVVFALLHFQIIPSPSAKDDFKVPDILTVKTYLDSVPQAVRAQARKENKPAAHFIGEVEGGKLLWQDSTQHSLSENGMKLVDNALVIPQEGLYFVYTQVAFAGSDCTEAIYLTHTVIRMSDPYQDRSPILTSSKSVCETASKSGWLQPLYQGGVFHLQKGDVLSTETTDVHFLEASEGQVYFGAIAV